MRRRRCCWRGSQEQEGRRRSLLNPWYFACRAGIDARLQHLNGALEDGDECFDTRAGSAPLCLRRCDCAARGGHRLDRNLCPVEAGRAGRAESSTPTIPRRSRRPRPIRASLTELVDHMPASDKVPSPLKFFGYIPGRTGAHDVLQGHRPLPGRARQGVGSRHDVQDWRERRRARHVAASRSPTKRRSSSSTSTGTSPRS